MVVQAAHVAADDAEPEAPRGAGATRTRRSASDGMVKRPTPNEARLTLG